MRNGLLAILSVIVLLAGSASPVLAITQGDINSIDNNTSFYDPDAVTCDSSGATAATALSGSDNEQKAYNYYVGKGLTAIQASAIVGNFKQESGVNPTEPGGYLAQWGGGRLTNLEALAAQQNKPVTDLEVQLDFSWQELTTSYSSVLQNLKGDTDITKATTDFMGTASVGGSVSGYENPGDPQLANRIMYAQGILSLYGGGAANSGTTVSSGSSCDGTSSIVCNTTTPATTGTTSDAGAVRQKVVCLAQSELALWKSQPNYGAAYPGFAYAETGYQKYTQGRSEEWCAGFVSWIFNESGDPLNAGSNWEISSVSSIQSMAQTSSNFTWHPESSGYTPVPGDIAIHLNGGVSHTNIFISSSGGVSTYVGGDQGNGPYPGGSMVSTETGNGYYANDISGYVSPN